MSLMCKMCISPYNAELMKAWRAHYPRRMLWERYNPLIWGKKGITYESFLVAVYKHQKHKDTGIVVVQTKNSPVKKTLSGIADMVTELAARKIETMEPGDISINDYVRVNKLVLDEKKLKLDQNEQMIELAKLFGIPEVIDPLEEAQDVHAQLGPIQNQGDQPEDSQ